MYWPEIFLGPGNTEGAPHGTHRHTTHQLMGGGGGKWGGEDGGDVGGWG